MDHCSEDEIVELKEDWGGPVFRLGKIYTLLNSMTDESRAYSVAKTLQAEWENILDNIINDTERFGLYEIEYTSETPQIDRSEGVLVIFPEVVCRLSDGYQVVIRIIVTVCVPPHHSKIWVRIAYNEDNGHLLTGKEMNLFFSDAEETCRALAKNLKMHYINALNKNGVDESLEKLHEFKIQVASTDLGKTGESIKSKKFTIKQILKVPKNNRRVLILLQRIFGERVRSFEQLEHIEEDEKWIKISISPDLLGVCFRRYGEKSSEFACLMHKSSEGLITSKSTNIFATSLLQIQVSRGL